jgi:hypothetical protein
MQVEREIKPQLAGCSGYGALVNDGFVGIVETPLYEPDSPEPEFLVLRVGNWPTILRPIVPASLVEDVDTDGRMVWLRGRRHEIVGLPERLPTLSEGPRLADSPRAR